jgi:peptidoglycan hydrolase-like protein with peptidoglycan-binding domain
VADHRILAPPPHRHRALWVGAALVVLVAAVGGVAYAVGRHHGSAGGPVHAAGSSGGTPSTAVATPLTVTGTTPATGATGVASDQTVSIRFSEPLTRGTAMPTFAPPVSGTWQRFSPTVLTFDAAAPFVPTTSETLAIPGGSSGPRATDGATLATPVTVTFAVAQSSTERLQQVLAQLDYLPLAFTPSAPLASPAEAATAQTGSFAWRWSTLPASLTSLWTEGTENVITKGAVMNFESQNGLTVDGLAGAQVWAALLADAASAKVDADPYTYVFVDKQLPETLTLYDNGAPTMSGILVNTGAPGADTVDGTYPVFEHVTSSRMVGTNPDGSTYDDPAVPWASFFNGGDALHGFVRATYGSPQSNGCVEMPVATAAQVWPLTPIGTLVTVTGPAS